jgi:hypothetical protein
MKRIILLLLIGLCFSVNCVSEKERREKCWQEIYQRKGFSTMTDFLIPEMVEAERGYSEIISLSGKNRFACIIGTEFGFGTFTEDLKLTYEPIVKGFADDAVGRLGADENGKILWGKQGYRGFLAVDAETKDTLNFVPSPSRKEGNSSKVYRAYLTELPGRILLFKLISVDENAPKYMLYDFKNKKEIFIPTGTTLPILSQPFFISKITYLLQTGNSNINRKWYLADLTTQGFNNFRSNPLTDSLSKKLFKADNWIRSRPFHSGNRMVIGNIATGDNSILSVVRWDSAFDNVRIEPLIMQCPAVYSFSSQNWTFSLDGKWLYTTAWKSQYSPMDDENELVFYHVDARYPQGISPQHGARLQNERPTACYCKEIIATVENGEMI